MSPQVYELRVRGSVPESLLREIGALDVAEEPPLTILRTEPTDQSGLHGMLQRLRSLGLDLLEVHDERRRARTPGTGSADRGSDRPGGSGAANGGAAPGIRPLSGSAAPRPLIRPG